MNNVPKPHPFIKWVGGKRSLLNEILSLLPQTFNTYFEPFLGGGAVLFALNDRLSKAVISDDNLELMITYKVIQREPQKLIEKLAAHATKSSETYFYSVRKQEPKDPTDVAARFIYLNKTCFNGLYRVNKSGKFNTPFGNHKNPNLDQVNNIMSCHELLQKVEILLADFETIQPTKGDFVYFDPPYHQLNDTSFIDYTSTSFTEKDHVRLRDFAVQLTKRGVNVMLSNSKTPFVEEIYKTKYFNHHIVLAPRFINSDGSNRDKVEELIITNY